MSSSESTRRALKDLPKIIKPPISTAYEKNNSGEDAGNSSQVLKVHINISIADPCQNAENYDGDELKREIVEMMRKLRLEIEGKTEGKEKKRKAFDVDVSVRSTKASLEENLKYMEQAERETSGKKKKKRSTKAKKSTKSRKYKSSSSSDSSKSSSSRRCLKKI